MKVLLGLLFLFATIASLEASSHGEAPLAAFFHRLMLRISMLSEALIQIEPDMSH